MNITDIDDKIIKRARQNYLFDRYANKLTKVSLNQLIDDQNEIWTAFEQICEKNTDVDKKSMLDKMSERLKNAMTLSQKAKDQDEAVVEEAKKVFLRDARDAIAEWLDKCEGHTVNENHIFEDLPRYWEDKFHEDMKALNVSI